METWRDIRNYEGLYQISNFGRVKSIARKIIKKDGVCQSVEEKLLRYHCNNKGYPQVALSKNSTIKVMAIHRLVAATFIPNPRELPQVNHKDGDKTNNAVENLEWCTQSENMRHAYKLGLWHGNAKIKAKED